AAWGADLSGAWIAVGKTGSDFPWPDAGQVYWYDGQNRILDVGAPARVIALSGTAADDVWAVGAGIAHWDGKAWRPVDVGGAGGSGAMAVFARARDDVWIGGGWEAPLRHFDGARWTEVPQEFGASVLAIWSSAPDDAWFAT